MKAFDEIFLTRDEKKVLSKIRHGEPVNETDIVDTLASDYLFVRVNYDRVYDDVRHITQHVPNGTYSITPQYERYRAYRRDLFFSGKLPVIISVIALIGAYRHEIFSVVRAIMQLLK